jgi:hypothetical protein
MKRKYFHASNMTSRKISGWSSDTLLEVQYSAGDVSYQFSLASLMLFPSSPSLPSPLFTIQPLSTNSHSLLFLFRITLFCAAIGLPGWGISPHKDLFCYTRQKMRPNTHASRSVSVRTHEPNVRALSLVAAGISSCILAIYIFVCVALVV